MRKSDVISVDRRRGRVALKPLGWVVVGVTVLVITGGLAWGVSGIVRGGFGIRPALIPTATAAPSAEYSDSTPTATVAPSAEYSDLAPTATAALPAGYLDLSQPEAQLKLREHFLEAWEWMFAPDVPQNIADLPLYFAPIPAGVSDKIFEPVQGWWMNQDSARDELEARAPIGLMSRVVLTGGQWTVTLLRWGDDGSWAVVQGRYGGHCRVEMVNAATGELAGAADSRCMNYVAGMVYDLADGRWKIASLWQLEPQATPVATGP